MPSQSKVMSTLKAAFPVLVLAVPLVLVVLLADQFGGTGIQRVITEALIKIVIVVGLYIFVGNSGIVSFGSIAYMAVAAYATTWQTCCAAMKPFIMTGLPEFLAKNTVPFVPAALLSIGLATLVAFLSGLVLMRLSGIAASIATLALLFIVNVTYSNWDSVTMGVSSIVGIPTYVTPWIALGAALLAIGIAYLFQTSRLGLALRASREDEVAAKAMGVSIYRSRLAAFTVSGAVMGAAGVLQAHYLGVLSIDMFFMQLTFISIAMLVVGGMGSLAGAVIGVVLLSTLIEIFRFAERGISVGGAQLSIPAGTQELVLALIMLFILIVRKEGLMGYREIRWPRGKAVDPKVPETGAVRPTQP